MEARTCSPAADSSPENVPSRRAESWLPGVMTTAAPAFNRRPTTRSSTAVASADGTARSYTSPATSTASTRSAATTAARPLSTDSCSASRSVPCSDRPMCQSEVCSSRMTRNVGTGYDRTGQARRDGTVTNRSDGDAPGIGRVGDSGPCCS